MCRALFTEYGTQLGVKGSPSKTVRRSLFELMVGSFDKTYRALLK